MLYGSTPTTALQPSMTSSSDSQHSTGPFDGGYQLPSGFGMYTMGDDDDAPAGAGPFNGETMTLPMSSGSLYNVPSYYQAGSYGGLANTATTYRAQSSRKVQGSAAATNGARSSKNSSTNAPNATLNAATASTDQLYGSCEPKAGTSAMQRSLYDGIGTSFHYDEVGEFYGSPRGGGERRGNSNSNHHNNASSRNNAVPMTRSGATTATSISECHLSRKDDGGFTPQTNNTFLQSHGSSGARSLDSRLGDRSALSEVGSGDEGASYFGTGLSDHGSESVYQNPPQRRLSESFRQETTLSSNSTISAATVVAAAASAQNGSGSSLARLSRSDRAVPVLASSPMPRAVPRPPPTQHGTIGSKAGVPRRRSSTELEGTPTQSISRWVNAHTDGAGDARGSSVEEVEARSSTASTSRASVVVSPAPSSASQRNGVPSTRASVDPPHATASTNATISKAATAPPMTEIPLLPSVPEKAAARSVSPAHAKSDVSSVLAPVNQSDVTAAAKHTGASPLQAASRGQTDSADAAHKKRTHVSHPDASSNASSSSSSRAPRTPPSRKPVKDKTTPPSKHTGTILPSAFAVSTTVTATKATLPESPRRISPGKRTHTGAAASTSTSVPLAVLDSKDTTLSSPSPTQRSATARDKATDQSTSLPPKLMAFTVAPPPSDTRDPNRFFRRRYLQAPVSPLSAVEIAKPVASAQTKQEPALSQFTAVSTIVSPAVASPPGRRPRNSPSLSSNMSPTVMNNLVGGSATAPSTNGNGVKSRLPPSNNRRGSSTSANILPQFSKADTTREQQQQQQQKSGPSSMTNRQRSGSETHSLGDAAGTAQSRSCPSLDLSMDEGTNPYLQRRSSSWSGHSTVCSSESGDGTHISSTRPRRKQDRMLPSVEEEMERYATARFGSRF